MTKKSESEALLADTGATNIREVEAVGVLARRGRFLKWTCYWF